MRIPDILRQRNGGVSFEIIPPALSGGEEDFLRIAAALKVYNPLYISVTSRSGRPPREPNLSAIARLVGQTGLAVVPHLTCLGATKDSLIRVLRDLEALGIETLFALRGDAPPQPPGSSLPAGDFRHASDLVAFIKGVAPRFTVGVGVYPEGHPESPDLETDWEYARQKFDAGADFAITQMFFDNAHFYRFRERMAQWGITAPIVPGIMPITDYPKLLQVASFCGVTVPRNLGERLAPLATDPAEMRRQGIEQTVRQCEDLLGNGALFLHFFTMNRVEAAAEVIEALSKNASYQWGIFHQQGTSSGTAN